MSFQNVTIASKEADAVRYLSHFDPRTTFGSRLNSLDLDAKMGVAYYVADKLVGDGGAAFVTDGTSTFCVCVAVAKRCLKHHAPKSQAGNNFEPLREFTL